ncbi:hypothetical protein TNCV_2024141 [Trichonephila clavipes]|nr:hypothetical protein TNCV_2024141 [Trichonephila clavipes]
MGAYCCQASEIDMFSLRNSITSEMYALELRNRAMPSIDEMARPLIAFCKTFNESSDSSNYISPVTVLFLGGSCFELHDRNKVF